MFEKKNFIIRLIDDCVRKGIDGQKLIAEIGKTLTKSEKDLYWLKVKGKTNKEISAELNKTAKEIKFEIKNIEQKLRNIYKSFANIYA